MTWKSRRFPFVGHPPVSSLSLLGGIFAPTCSADCCSLPRDRSTTTTCVAPSRATGRLSRGVVEILYIFPRESEQVQFTSALGSESLLWGSPGALETTATMMGSLSTSRVFSSRSSRTCNGGFLHSEPKLLQHGTVPCASNKITNYHGLRSLNNIGVFQNRKNLKAGARQTKMKQPKNGNLQPFPVITCLQGIRIVFVSAEVAPWSKTGGLGDVLAGLPPALAAFGHRAMTISPRYDQYKDAWDTKVSIEVKVGNNLYTVKIFHCYKRGVDRVFVDHPIFLEKVWGKTGGKIYGPIAGEDYADNQLRFSILCQAALEIPRVLNLENEYFSGPYGEDVVFVCNDWHTALLPCYLKSMYKSNGIYMNAKVAFCIHNIAYQGRFALSDFDYLGLPDSFKPSFDFFDGYEKPVKGRKSNWMKAGILESDKVFTVSPYYAKELLSGEERGVELDLVLNKKGIIGIVNGSDVTEWSPSTDKYIPIKFDATTVTEAKPIIKEALQAEVGLPVDRTVPLIGFIGRLEEQKGSDILAEAIPKFIDENVQLVALGTGKKKMEKQLEQLEEQYPGKAVGVAKFNVPLAHLILAGADIIMIPSRFEPCGLIQLQAMPYGTLPAVTTTGGLADTVEDGVTGFQMGTFHVDCEVVDPEDVAAIASTVKRIIGVYGTPAFSVMIQNCMALDLSWKGPAKRWEEELLSMGLAHSGPGIDGEEIAPLALENVASP